MTILTDGKRRIGIVMNIWEGNHYSHDFSNDFFNVGSLPYDEERSAYIVGDVEYCIEQAMDWREKIGDYADGEYDDNANVGIVFDEMEV